MGLFDRIKNTIADAARDTYNFVTGKNLQPAYAGIPDEYRTESRVAKAIAQAGSRVSKAIAEEAEKAERYQTATRVLKAIRENESSGLEYNLRAEMQPASQHVQPKAEEYTDEETRKLEAVVDAQKDKYSVLGEEDACAVKANIQYLRERAECLFRGEVKLNDLELDNIKEMNEILKGIYRKNFDKYRNSNPDVQRDIITIVRLNEKIIADLKNKNFKPGKSLSERLFDNLDEQVSLRYIEKMRTIPTDWNKRREYVPWNNGNSAPIFLNGLASIYDDSESQNPNKKFKGLEPRIRNYIREEKFFI